MLPCDCIHLQCLQAFKARTHVGFQHQQTLTLRSNQPQLYNLAYDSKSSLLLLGNTLGSTLVVLHVMPSLDSFDSIAQFEVVVPIISLEAVQSPAESSDPEAIQVRGGNHMTSSKPPSSRKVGNIELSKSMHDRISESRALSSQGTINSCIPDLTVMEWPAHALCVAEVTSRSYMD